MSSVIVIFMKTFGFANFDLPTLKCLWRGVTGVNKYFKSKQYLKLFAGPDRHPFTAVAWAVENKTKKLTYVS